MKRKNIERIEVPQRVVDIATARCEPMIRHAACFSENVLVDVALSCYLQGALDALDAETRKALAERRGRP